MVAHMARTDAHYAQVTVWILAGVFCLIVPLGLWFIKGDLEMKDEVKAEQIRNARERRELERLKREVQALVAEKGSNDKKRDGNSD
jgi:hypothetical protein